MSITKAERSALAKLVEQRFKVLQIELDNRRDQLAEQIRDRLVAESEAQCAKAAKRLEKFAKRAEALAEQVKAEAEAITAELGVVPGEVTTYREWAYPYTDASHKGTREVLRVKTHRYSPVELTVRTKFAPVNLEQTIEREIKRLTQQRVLGGRSLDSIRLDLQEQLLLGEVQGDDAKAFLEKVPTIDALLPLPGGNDRPSLGQ